MAGLPTKDSTASFWHSEPSTLLLDHRTTPELPSYADVVIVGSGITGASAARFLAEDERAKGASIVMLEARQACWGATGRVSHPSASPSFHPCHFYYFISFRIPIHKKVIETYR